MAVDTKDVAQNFANIKSNIEEAYQTFQSNRKRYNEFMKFVFQTSLSGEDRDILAITDKPDIEFNILEPYVARQLGEFAKQEPGFSVHALDNQVDPQTVDVVEGIMRSILRDADKNSFSYNVYKEVLGGGYSVMKVLTDYEHEDSFNQNIKLTKVYDPTLTGFDPLAREPHKGDGGYCFELYPKTIEDFKKEYPDENVDNLKYDNNLQGFQWKYRNMKTDIVLMAEYYCKKKKRTRLHLLTDGSTMSDKKYKEMINGWSSIEQPPQVVKSRWTEKTVICRYVVIQDRVLEYSETNYLHLPLIFVDGNSALVTQNKASNDCEQVTRPFVYNAMGAQRLKNFAGQSLGNELENIMQNKYIVDKEAIPEDAVEDWTNPQKASTLVYSSRDKDGNQLPAPIPVQRGDIPGIISQTFMGVDQNVQAQLGAFNQQLSNQKQVSGVAIQEAMSANNAVSAPYNKGYLMALTQAAQMILEMIPMYYATPRTVPVVDRKGKRSYLQINQTLPNGMPQPGSPQLKYDPNILEVDVSAGFNYETQKNRALGQMVELMNASQGFRAMIEQEGLPMLVGNLDIKGVEQLTQMAEQFTQQQKQMQAMQAQQGQQSNPAVLAAQAKQSELQLQSQKMQADIQLDQANLQLKQQQMQNDHTIQLLKIQAQQEAGQVQLAKAHAENLRSTADMHLKANDQAHRHGQDILNNVKEVKTNDEDE
ncbi:MAG: hypothetical protein JSW00_04035 [Thermoplasmata archaeon]|nr:MAG: hypothetical protein JSW00_04035 [Thermoplasmata archaeon]